jgi:hypothetical protein
MASFLLEVDASQVGNALEALARAGVPVRQLDDAPPRRSPAPPAADLFAGTLQSAAPKGAWTRGAPVGTANEWAQSAGQTEKGHTVWLLRAPGDSIGWVTTPPALAVRLEGPPYPRDLVAELGGEGLARVLRAASDAPEGR